MANDFFDKIADGANNLVEKIKAALNKQKTVSISSEDKSASQALVAELKAMEADYRNKTALPAIDRERALPATLGLTPKTYTPLTEAEIKKQAETALTADYAENLNDLNEDLQEKYTDNAIARNKAADEYVEGKSELKDLKDDMSESHQSSMIMQGITNSSINTQGKEGIESYYDAQIKAISNDYNTKLAELNAEISIAELSFNQALYRYDLQYAADLQLKIDELTIKQESLKEEINAYNAKIAKQEADYQAKREATLSKMEAEREAKQAELDAKALLDAKANGYSGELADEMNERYKLALGVYGALDKDVALSLINDQSEALKSSLGLYFEQLVNQINNK